MSNRCSIALSAHWKRSCDRPDSAAPCCSRPGSAALRQPICWKTRAISSGPVSPWARSWASSRPRGGFRNVVICDIGGTSVDIGVLKDQTIATTTESVTGDQKNALEAMDIPSIGAGGGAIAWIDNTGVLRVGPASAGANPGPACYGKGGKQPTLTDANVMLGYIPDRLFSRRGNSAR